MPVWIIWVSVLALGVVWFSFVALLCRQIAAGKWEPDYWPPDPTSAAEPVSLEELRQSFGSETDAGSIVRVRFTREGGFCER